MQDVRQYAHGQIGAGGVAADDDVLGRVTEGGDGVAEERDGLLELARVDGVGGEGVREHESRDGGGGEGVDEGEVAGVRGEVVAAAWEGCLSQ